MNHIWDVQEGPMARHTDRETSHAAAMKRVEELEDWFAQVNETEEIDARGVWKQAQARGRAILAARAQEKSK